jgi:hypothetical protein
VTILSWLDDFFGSAHVVFCGKLDDGARGTNRVAGITRVSGVDLTRLGSAAENPFEAWLGPALVWGIAPTEEVAG